MTTEFVEDWSTPCSSQNHFLTYRKQWGKNNNGVVPETLSFEVDEVTPGVQQRVLVITAQGASNTTGVIGIKKIGAVDCTRVGGCIVSKSYFASGTYEVTMKIGLANNGELPVGMVPAIWAFGYEEHYHDRNNLDGTQLSLNDPLYQPHLKQGNQEDGFYSAVNAEIDFPEIGVEGDFSYGQYCSYYDNDEGQSHAQRIPFPINTDHVVDGQYHRYKIVWTTKLTPLHTQDLHTVEYQGNRYITDDPIYPQHQGKLAIQKEEDREWYLPEGEEVVYYFDEMEIGRAPVTALAGRLVVGVWFPDWGNNPCNLEASQWETAKVYISRVEARPSFQEGDVYSRTGLYMEDGIVPFPEI
jgi:hypothetical protein